MRNAANEHGPLQIGILGSLRVLDTCGELRIRGSKRRALLVRLVMAPNSIVSVERLVDDLWRGEGDAGSESTLRSHISLLRGLVGAERIRSAGCGYSCLVENEELDSAIFESESASGRRALVGGDPLAAEKHLGCALEQWRGPALADVQTALWALPEISRLEELRLTTVEMWHEILLLQGRHREVVASTESWLARNPLDEGLRAQQMLALYRSGRQAEALRSFRELRIALDAELGVEPTRELARLEEAIVVKSAELDDAYVLPSRFAAIAR